ncbi:MAG: condensation domain-containing protein, partial [Calditrichia bacterium]
MNNASFYELLADGLQLWLKGEQIGFKVFQGKLSPELREKLVAAKPDLLRTLLPGRRYSLCSFPQQRLWFLEQFEGASPVYNIHATHMLCGKLNMSALQQSVDRLIQRHEAFRTSFHALDGQPYQQIHDSMMLQIPVKDLSAESEANQPAKLQQLLVEEVETEFELETAPLIRVKLYKLAEEKHALLILTHHIIFDGWSLGLTINELSANYSAICAGEDSETTMPGVQYSDHVMWQREWFLGDGAQRQLDYWTEKLSGELAPLELPYDKPRPPIQSIDGDVEFDRFEADLIQKMSERARQENVSLFMFLVTAVNVLIMRYSNQEDILLGMPVANRKRKEVESIVGYFANTLVLRNDLSGNPTFSEMLQRVRAVCLEAFNNEDTPFEQIVGVLQPERDRSRTPIFQAMVSYDETASHARSMGELTMERLSVERKVARTDLAIWLTKESDHIRFAFEYASHLFERNTIKRLVAGMKSLAEAAAADTSIAISELPVMPAQEE